LAGFLLLFISLLITCGDRGWIGREDDGFYEAVSASDGGGAGGYPGS
jgi:hypothetical protein